MARMAQARRLGRYFIFLDTALVVFGFFIVFPLISLHFVDQMSWAAAAVGLALAIRQLLQQGLGLLGGSLADRYGARPLIVGGMLLRAAGFAAMAEAESATLLIFSCVLSGLGGTLFDPPRSALILKLTRPSERSRFYALLMMVESAAGVAGAMIGSWLLHFDFWWVGMGGGAIFVLAAAANLWLLPRYRVTARRSSPLASMRTVLADRRYMQLVLTLSGYYALGVQIMLLVPVVLKQLTGSNQAVGWMFALETVLSLSLLYPLARIGERHFTPAGRILCGIGLMCFSLLLMSMIRQPVMAFAVLALFYIGSLITEPARETLLASMASSEARASYTGTSRLGLALGGAAGYLGGGWLLDISRSMALPALPWLVLTVVGIVTLLALQRQLQTPSIGRLHASGALGQ